MPKAIKAIWLHEHGWIVLNFYNWTWFLPESYLSVHQPDWRLIKAQNTCSINVFGKSFQRKGCDYLHHLQSLSLPLLLCLKWFWSCWGVNLSHHEMAEHQPVSYSIEAIKLQILGKDLHSICTWKRREDLEMGKPGRWIISFFLFPSHK